MTWSGFDLAWPWIGLAGASGLLILLLATPWLRRPGAAGSRWRDPVWLSWLSTVAYLLHQVEEYGVDALGRAHTFPDALCTALGQGPFPGCAIPPVLFLAVNIPLIWISGPVSASLARWRPLAGMGVFGIAAVNMVVHLLPLVAGKGYAPGLLTAVLVFAPLCAWVVHVCFGPGRPFSRRDLALVLALGVAGHASLMASLQAYLHGLIGVTALAAVQIANAAALPAILWLWAGRRRA